MKSSVISIKSHLVKLYLLNKRQKIILTSVILSLGLLYTQLVPFYLTYKFILALGLLAYFLSLWSLFEGISRLKAVVLLLLPTLFTISVASYYFLLPIRWLTRLPVAITFGLSYYCLLLSQNVFNVASIRTIPLYRAASTVTFLFTLITSFLILNVLYSFELPFFYNGLATFLISFPLILQVIWSVEMDRIDSVVLITSGVLALVLSEVALSLSFWPILGSMAALVLSTILYVVLGVTTHRIRDQLSRGVVTEYVLVASAVLFVALVSTSWRG